MLLFRRRELAALGDAVPLFQASSATRAGRVLRDEDGVPAPRSLLPIVARCGWRQTIPHEVTRVIDHHGESLRGQIGALGRTEMKALPKGGGFQLLEDDVEIAHVCNTRKAPASVSRSTETWRTGWTGR